MDLLKLNELLSQGICPDELNFALASPPLDIEKIKYNAFYRSYEFVEGKFPKGYKSIPGMELIIQSIADKYEEENITPLSEILEKSKLREE